MKTRVGCVESIHCRVTVPVGLVRIVINRASVTKEDCLLRYVLYTYEMCSNVSARCRRPLLLLRFASEGEKSERERVRVQ